MRTAFAINLTLALCAASATAASPLRPLRRVAAAELEPLARAAISATLPEGTKLKSVRLPATMSLREGELQVALAGPLSAPTGRRAVALLISAGGERPTRLAAIAEFESQADQRSAVTRGSQVQVIVRMPGILVLTHGIAQANAACGEAVPVLADGGRKILNARVIDAKTVEVLP